MTPILGRFFRGGRHQAHAEGIALLEEGRYAEAVARLREAAHGRGDPATSLAASHFRQALVGEGRRLLRAGEANAARAHFAEAAELWPVYPDLHALLGAARTALGAWDGALSAARAALRINPDYIEARTLEAAALAGLGRDREAAESLNALLESGRRVEHWLLGRLQRDGGYTAATVPTNLADLVLEAASGVSEKEEVAAAVALCRAGRWDEGLERFAALVERRPRYPDYRTRHAAALYQLRRNDAALAEVEAALALNEGYRAAADLKALVLADSGRVAEARAFACGADHRGGAGAGGGAHEALFAAYLRGVLAVLVGRPAEVAPLLAPWPDLPRSFARAGLLLAAADDLCGRPDAALRRLEELAGEWTAEPLYAWLLVGSLRRAGRLRDAAAALGRWPAASGGIDWRPLLLEGHLAVDQGREPALPAGRDAAPGDPVVAGADGPRPGADAWTFLDARAALQRGDAVRALALADGLAAAGSTEQLEILRTRAAGQMPKPGAWQPAAVTPDALLRTAVPLRFARGDTDAAVAMLAAQGRLHPDDPAVCWLSPGFWLEPIRAWIG
ncbi:MAG TPA: hypothetical protein PLQ13_03690 [Candidatus Krumholzibacteria bacterium]|nr:hypothetical protein [Candidatus Krumholzibacteria bacterium]